MKHDLMWVLVREVDVLASARTQAPRPVQNDAEWRAHCTDFLRTRLMCHAAGLATTEMIWPLACRAQDEPAAFWAILQRVRTAFNHALASALNRLCELLPEAGADQMEIPVGADGDVDWQEALFPMAAALLTYLADRLVEGADHMDAEQHSPFPEDAVHDALTDLATLLSDRLTEQSPFFDASARSVHIPNDSALKAALAAGEQFVLVPVRRIGT
ncbi:hypothetical protein GPA22_00910 [Aromatoleum toluvorans]|uniref:Uncharacterized protein n=1 Tax=Aromatoleum toluvorans TaxID=92002 RepID=A0ABX1PUE0_9RHOO|nr:hypothetical protein [Aromatoleum toluvorans]NMG42297.1 hypothetical protein [Aromatoleum toluvorans]